MSAKINESELSSRITNEFGANATYVEELLKRYLADPASIDPIWAEYFVKLIGETPSPQQSAPATQPAQPAQPAPQSAPAAAPQPAAARPSQPPAGERQPIRGASLKIVENMETSLGVPTATSQRTIPIRLLDENRQIINKHQQLLGGSKVSYTHIIAFALLRAVDKFPGLNDGYEEVDGQAYRVVRRDVNLGVAVDVTKKDGTRTLMVPNVKAANRMSFAEFLAAYDDVVKRARIGKLTLDDFQGTTISLTNPGTIGTNASTPRLMAGQGLIFATGAIGYPAEYQAVSPEALSQLGLSKVITVTSTYDHRIIQGAESGSFLQRIHELLLGEDGFYESIFEDLEIPLRPLRWATDSRFALGAGRGEDTLEAKMKQARVFDLINAYRVRGHLMADLDPLRQKKVEHHPELEMEHYGLTVWDLDREFVTGGLGGVEVATLRQILEMLRAFYCGSVGYEYRHIQSPDEKEWLRAHIESKPAPIPAEVRKRILWKIISAEQFERFLGRKYIGQKRFSIEGNETAVAILDQLIERAGEQGVREVIIGMAHRGRLNVLANVIGKFCERIFTAFEGQVHPDFPNDANDVKYHQGATGMRVIESGREMALTVSPNPSHLEFVDPVVVGRARARQDQTGNDPDAVLPIQIHGDAAFAGQGVVAETLNMSKLDAYSVGGSIHLIFNNQIGFTTDPEQGRSMTYSTDLAKAIQAPIFHVNADDPDAAFNVMLMALGYRQQFNKDVVIDIIGYRRHGHNEGDEPTYTQPVMYRAVEAHPGVQTIYANRLVGEKVMTAEEVEGLVKDRIERYEDALARAKRTVAERALALAPQPAPREPEHVEVVDTAVDAETMGHISDTITYVPHQFNLNPKVVTLLSRRAKMGKGEAPVDWAFAEALAFGSLLLEGIPVRLTGEDVTRGTFSHRHAIFYDMRTDEPWIPLLNLSPDQARLWIYDSPLSEAGVLGFEYGYSVDAPEALVLWEAQFGDFVNAGQVAVDQFIAAGEAKWGQTCRLVLLLPHGFEGQGPEHSSARLERFLQLCAGSNMQVCNPTTPAQYFHMLRRQMTQPDGKPLIVMTPKSLLRLPDAASPIEEFERGGFRPVIDDAAAGDAGSVRRVILCSGKVYYELAAARAKQFGDAGAAIVRVEQYYPFPKGNIRMVLDRYPNASEVVWVQEEPQNQGAWFFVEPRLRDVVGRRALRYAGRPASPSVATGSHAIHAMEQKRLVTDAFGAGSEGSGAQVPVIHGVQSDG